MSPASATTSKSSSASRSRRSALRTTAWSSASTMLIDPITLKPLAKAYRQAEKVAAGRVSARNFAFAHEQRLQGPADRAGLIAQGRVRDPDAVRLGQRDRIEADPLAGRQPVQMNGEIHVDEDVLLELERGAGPVARISGRQHALQRR